MAKAMGLHNMFAAVCSISAIGAIGALVFERQNRGGRP
jgi:hypothetical protein